MTTKIITNNLKQKHKYYLIFKTLTDPLYMHFYLYYIILDAVTSHKQMFIFLLRILRTNNRMS